MTGGNVKQEVPPTRLCRCDHTFHVHRPGHCNIVTGCQCTGFTEQALEWKATTALKSWGRDMYGRMD